MASNKEAVARYRARHPERVRGQNARYRAVKRASGAQQAYDKARYDRDPVGQNERNAEWRRANPEKERERNRRWRAANPDAAAAKNATRRARTKNVLTPLERLCIRAFHSTARFLTELTGVAHHVDHVVPLAKGGLHHPRNLQVLTAKENQSKGAS